MVLLSMFENGTTTATAVTTTIDGGHIVLLLLIILLIVGISVLVWLVIDTSKLIREKTKYYEKLNKELGKKK